MNKLQLETKEYDYDYSLGTSTIRRPEKAYRWQLTDEEGHLIEEGYRFHRTKKEALEAFRSICRLAQSGGIINMGV